MALVLCICFTATALKGVTYASTPEVLKSNRAGDINGFSTFILPPDFCALKEKLESAEANKRQKIFPDDDTDIPSLRAVRYRALSSRLGQGRHAGQVVQVVLVSGIIA
jgi:hypothetical protein